MAKFNGKSLLCAEQDVKRYNCYQKCEIKVLMERIGVCVCVMRELEEKESTTMTMVATSTTTGEGLTFLVFVLFVLSLVS